MSKYFVALNNGTVEQRNAITHLFSGGPWGYWHQFEDVWLLESPIADTPSAKELFVRISALPQIGQSTPIVIVRLPEGVPQHWGIAQQSGWEWMKKYFGTAE